MKSAFPRTGEMLGFSTLAWSAYGYEIFTAQYDAALPVAVLRQDLSAIYILWCPIPVPMGSLPFQSMASAGM
jgi:hypothetical protein